MANATKTIRNQIVRRPGLEDWYTTTRALYNDVVRFYFDLYEAHPALADMSTDDALKQIELMSVRTKLNPTPPFPITEAIPADIPAMLRRAAIRAARGAYKSWRSNYENWQRAKAKHEEKNQRRKKPKPFRKRPPVPPRDFNFNVNFYSGMSKERAADSIMLKFWTGKSWQWTKVYFTGRAVPAGLEAQSPTLVQKPGGYFKLHTPVKRSFQSPGRILEQGAANKNLTVCSVDLNLDGSAAVCVILRADGTVLARKHVKHSGKVLHRRKRLLGRIDQKRRKTGVLAKDEQDNVALWRKVRNYDEQLAHLASRRIVDFAVEYGAQVLVFEHLERLRLTSGMYSRRTNRKRNYWLKGRIFRYAKYKAWEVGLITSRINPRYTSQDCHRCGKRPVVRFTPPQAPDGYNPGGQLYICLECYSRGNADENAAINIGLRFFHRLFKNLSESATAKGKSRVEPHADVFLRLEKLGMVRLNGEAAPGLSIAKMRCASNGRAYGSTANDSVYATANRSPRL